MAVSLPPPPPDAAGNWNPTPGAAGPSAQQPQHQSGSRYFWDIRVANPAFRAGALAIDMLVLMGLTPLVATAFGRYAFETMILVASLNWVVLECAIGASLGKLVLGLQTVTVGIATRSYKHPGGPFLAYPTVGSSMARVAVTLFVDVLPFGLGFFWCLFDPLGQTLGDKAGHVVVLRPAERIRLQRIQSIPDAVRAM